MTPAQHIAEAEKTLEALDRHDYTAEQAIGHALVALFHVIDDIRQGHTGRYLRQGERP